MASHNVVETYTIRKSQDIHSHAYINQYELISTLGEGMHGKVMLARDSIANERVAIKIMRRNDPHNRRLPKSNRLGAPPLTAQQETESKIRREIAVMKKCSHQNLVRLLEVIDDPASKKVYLVMENLEGGEVKWRSKNFDEPVLQLTQVQRIMRDVTLGLEYLHHQGIIHRDIKPANLLWTADRQSVKICDFGVSHFAVAAATAQDPNLYDEAGLTKTAGSPAFFAPEICHIPEFSFEDSSSPVSHRGSQSSHSQNAQNTAFPPITKQIDIWALGVTFYCLLFGVPPWQGQTEFAMFRAICNEDFPLPDTMTCDRIPTGGRDRKPEGKEIGWCVVGLLEGLLEKDQDRRITLADIKSIPWIQNGVREPEQWLRETAPSKDTRVIVTEEDTKSAIKRARFSYSGWITRLTSTFKRVPFSLIQSSRSSSKGAGTVKIESSGSRKRNNQPEIGVSGPSKRHDQIKLSEARASRTKGVMDRQLKRFTFSHSSLAHSNTLPSSPTHRRNSSYAPTTQRSQSVSDPTSHIDYSYASVRRHAVAMGDQGINSRSWSTRRKSDSLQLPSRSGGFSMGTSSTPVSCSPSPTTPEEQLGTRNKPKLRLSQVFRSNSAKRAVKSVKGARTGRKDESPARGRTSAETLDVLRPSEDLGLTHAMRASSWGSPAAEVVVDDDDGHTSFDLTGSEAGTGVLQDFNKSVVRFGAGGYIDSPTSPRPAASQFQCMNSPGPSGSGYRTSTARMTQSDSSSNSTATASTPHAYRDASQHQGSVSSPLARPCDHCEEEGDDDLSSDVFEDTGTDDIDDDPPDSDEEVLELRTRRPSVVLSRSANVSPLRS